MLGYVSIDLPARILRLLGLLQSRREWSGADLAERLGVTVRTVRRDVERLRELGYPVHGTTGTAGGYRLASGTNLPPLLLEDDEAVAVAIGLRTAANGGVSGVEETSVRALVKLEQILPTRLRRHVAALGEATVTVAQHGLSQVDPTTLTVIARACRDNEVLSFDYQNRYSAATSRCVEPHSLVTIHGRWYLVAFDTDRDDWRTFRVDRLADPVAGRRRFTPRPLPAEDAAAYLAGSLTAAPYRYTATATVHAPAQTVRGRLHAPLPGRVEPVDEDTCTVTFGADSAEHVLQDLVALSADFTLEGSPELLEQVRTVGRRLIDAAQT